MNAPPDVVASIESLASTSSGDVPDLLQRIRSSSPQLADDAACASAIESALRSRASAGDRTGAWWLACALSLLRPSPFSTAQDEAERTSARAFGELWQSPTALAPIPEPARWIVAGDAEPAASPATIELARRNAAAHFECLESELAARTTTFRSRAELAKGDAATTAALDAAILTFEAGAFGVRAALLRAVDHVVARSRDLSLAAAGETALREVDARLPPLRAKVLEARRLVAAAADPRAQAPAPPPANPARHVSLHGEMNLSFAGAPPPALRRGSLAEANVVASASQPTSREALDQAMHVAFERAWTEPGEATRRAFMDAVRARYQLETATIEDPDERTRALEHYVAHAVAQLPA